MVNSYYRIPEKLQYHSYSHGIRVNRILRRAWRLIYFGVVVLRFQLHLFWSRGSPFSAAFILESRFSVFSRIYSGVWQTIITIILVQSHPPRYSASEYYYPHNITRLNQCRHSAIDMRRFTENDMPHIASPFLCIMRTDIGTRGRHYYKC